MLVKLTKPPLQTSLIRPNHIKINIIIFLITEKTGRKAPVHSLIDGLYRRVIIPLPRPRIISVALIKELMD